jgi:hypothetical protein
VSRSDLVLLVSAVGLVTCLVFELGAGCSRPSPKTGAPAPSCCCTSAPKVWIEPIDCRHAPDWIDPWDLPDAGKP